MTPTASPFSNNWLTTFTIRELMLNNMMRDKNNLKKEKSSSAQVIDRL